jgi:hypothetical protein
LEIKKSLIVISKNLFVKKMLINWCKTEFEKSFAFDDVSIYFEEKYFGKRKTGNFI